MFRILWDHLALYKDLRIVMILEAIDSIFQKIVEIDIVKSKPMLCFNNIRTFKCTCTRGRDERLLFLNQEFTSLISE